MSAYRYFATEKRSFIVADAPGHEQFTRNMATGASNSDLAVILVDARKGVVLTDRRHADRSLLGITHVVLAVNKMDLLDFDQRVFEDIAADYRGICRASHSSRWSRSRWRRVSATMSSRRARRRPGIAGRRCCNSWKRSSWGLGSPATPFRFPVQLVNRPNPISADFPERWRAAGSRAAIPSSWRRRGGERVARIVTFNGDLESAEAGDAVTLTLTDEVDIARGDLLAPPHAAADRRPVRRACALDGHRPLLPGRSYWMRIGTQWAAATVSTIKHKLDVQRLDHLAARTLALNEIGFCNLSTAIPVAFDPYARTGRPARSSWSTATATGRSGPG